VNFIIKILAFTPFSIHYRINKLYFSSIHRHLDGIFQKWRENQHDYTSLNVMINFYRFGVKQKEEKKETSQTDPPQIRINTEDGPASIFSPFLLS
jgi:hypothetical protein